MSNAVESRRERDSARRDKKQHTFSRMVDKIRTVGRVYNRVCYQIIILSLSVFIEFYPEPDDMLKQSLSYDDCLEVRGEIIIIVLCCIVY